MQVHVSQLSIRIDGDGAECRLLAPALDILDREVFLMGLLEVSE